MAVKTRICRTLRAAAVIPQPSAERCGRTRSALHLPSELPRVPANREIQTKQWTTHRTFKVNRSVRPRETSRKKTRPATCVRRDTCSSAMAASSRVGRDCANILFCSNIAQVPAYPRRGRRRGIRSVCIQTWLRHRSRRPSRFAVKVCWFRLIVFGVVRFQCRRFVAGDARFSGCSEFERCASRDKWRQNPLGRSRPFPPIARRFRLFVVRLLSAFVCCAVA